MPRTTPFRTSTALLWAIASLLLLGQPLSLMQSAAIGAEDGFVPIFNGKDLNGWEGEPGWWSVEDGAITGITTAEKPLDHPTYLFWRGGKPADFELHAMYRFLTPGGNSGINFRSRELPKWDIQGYQADMETGPSYTGILYECNQRAIMTERGQKVVIAEDGQREVTTLATAQELQKVIKPNDWNEYVIIARGPEIILKINGAIMSHVIDREKGKAAADGLLSIQSHPGPPMKVQFKDIRIKYLGQNPSGSVQPNDIETNSKVPPSWEILPIPRYVDYGSPESLLTVKKVAIVRKEGGPYQSVRDNAGHLAGQSTVTEEELVQVLKENGVTSITSVADDLPDYADYDTLILLGKPEHNRQTARRFAEMKLSFAKWDDPHTPEHDFKDWKDFGREGYLLKADQVGGQNIVILAGNDFDDARNEFYGAGTFYAFQSFKQLIGKDGDKVQIKTAEIADCPLVAHRGCFTAFFPVEELEWWKIKMMTAMKANANIFWYGDQLGFQSAATCSQFRQPWKPEQIDVISKFGRWCREHFISMTMSWNPDHYNSDWAAAKTFDGKTKDPLHYDPNHGVEPEYKELWAKAGYDVKNDVDIVASKFAQVNKALGGGATLTMMNEDDVFGLVHPEDKKLFNTEGPDPKQNAINYGKARSQFLVTLYRRVRELAPDSCDIMPICPPDGVAYQTPLENNDFNSRDFMESLATELKAAGLQAKLPVITTGGGTQAEVVSNKNIDDFRSWCVGAPVVLLENNFMLGRIGAYETDPNGPRWPMQRSDKYPAGFHDRELYKRVWGLQWNMNSPVAAPVMAWSQAQYMWNMLALDKKKIDALATRKVCSAQSYPLVRSLYEEFYRPACYCPDDGLATLMAVCDTLAFPRKDWQTVITYTDDKRLAAQRIRDKFAILLPELEAKWEEPLARKASLRELGYNAFNFCSIYLARGYIEGWKDQAVPPENLLDGDRLRDLYLEADAIQERYFNGPEEIPGKSVISRNYYNSVPNRLYVETLKPPPAKPSEAKFYVDIWKDGLLGKFFAPVSAVVLADVSDGDARLSGGWGKVEEADQEKFRAMTGAAQIKIDAAAEGALLVRARIGTSLTTLADSTFSVEVSPSTAVSLSAGDASHADAICKTRWITWLLPAKNVSQLTIQAEKPVRVYAIEVYREIK